MRGFDLGTLLPPTSEVVPLSPDRVYIFIKVETVSY
jgi:hypothetical protein